MKKSWGDLLEGSVVHRAVEQNLPRMGFVGDNLQFIEERPALSSVTSIIASIAFNSVELFKFSNWSETWTNLCSQSQPQYAYAQDRPEYR